MTNKLIKICKQYVPSGTLNAVIAQPYIPFVPEDWNGVLVLAESQNLSKKNTRYVAWLNDLSDRDRIRRLYLRGSVDIQPWDDGSLKLAVEALKFKASQTAVCNAVLWSQRGENDKNDNPDQDLQQHSYRVWSKLLPVLNPTLVICCGKIAKDVIAATGWAGKTFALRLPSPSALSRISGMFNEADLLHRYPEVKNVVNKHPEWLQGGYRLNKIFFACHAVSLFNAK